MGLGRWRRGSRPGGRLGIDNQADAVRSYKKCGLRGCSEVWLAIGEAWPGLSQLQAGSQTVLGCSEEAENASLISAALWSRWRE